MNIIFIYISNGFIQVQCEPDGVSSIYGPIQFNSEGLLVIYDRSDSILAVRDLGVKQFISTDYIIINIIIIIIILFTCFNILF